MTFRPCPKPVSPPPAKPRRVKRKNVKRSTKAWKAAFHSAERVQFVASMGCEVARDGGCLGAVQNHHTKNGGMGLKASYTTIIPLCAAHHAQIHQIGKVRFMQCHALNLSEAARQTELAWLSASKSHISEREGRAT